MTKYFLLCWCIMGFDDRLIGIHLIIVMTVYLRPIFLPSFDSMLSISLFSALSADVDSTSKWSQSKARGEIGVREEFPDAVRIFKAPEKYGMLFIFGWYMPYRNTFCIFTLFYFARFNLLRCPAFLPVISHDFSPLLFKYLFFSLDYCSSSNSVRSWGSFFELDCWGFLSHALFPLDQWW